MAQEKENKTIQPDERTACVKVAQYLARNCSLSADEQPCWHLQVGVLLMFYILLPACACECVLPVTSEMRRWLRFVAVLIPEVSADPDPA